MGKRFSKRLLTIKRNIFSILLNNQMELTDRQLIERRIKEIKIRRKM